jgi:hypothetical protein
LFLLKPHPTEPLDTALFQSLPANALILDEFACWWSGLTTADLIRAADGVIGTTATTVLEAALAGKPCVIVETGNPVRYAGVSLTPPDGVADLLAAHPDHRGYSTGFASAFYDTSSLGSALSNVFEALHRASCSPSGTDAAQLRSTCVEMALASQLSWFVDEYGRAIRRPVDAFWSSGVRPASLQPSQANRPEGQQSRDKIHRRRGLGQFCHVNQVGPAIVGPEDPAAVNIVRVIDAQPQPVSSTAWNGDAAARTCQNNVIEVCV